MKVSTFRYIFDLISQNIEQYLYTRFTLNSTFMLRWSVIFLVVAIIAGVFGFGGIAAGAAEIAKILFYLFLVLFVISLIFGRGRG
jgi:uncharacterized membrane protein YtjA (UPF0391 family)